MELEKTSTTEKAKRPVVLPSWNPGSAKRAIIDFVTRVSRKESIDYVPIAERIAVFDNDGTLWAEKPVYIYIGRRPIAAFGNSDGDFEMLQWISGQDGPHLSMLIHHTDESREWAYDHESRVGHLDRALNAAPANQWTVVDMKKDWNRLFPF